MIPTRTPIPRTTHLIAWQGWTMTVPTTWNPVKVDGDADAGSILLADLHAARLGLRWTQAPRRGGPADWIEKSMRNEVGRDAAAHAVDVTEADAGTWSAAKVCRDPSPPARDVFVGHARRSGRLLQVVHHVVTGRADSSEDVLRSLDDTPPGGAADWSIFDLSFRTPPGVGVRWYRFNAGDLSVGLADAKGRIAVVRQVGPAGLALGRQPLANWLRQSQAATRKLYRPIGVDGPATLTTAAGRTIDGRRGTLVRRRRLWWAWMIAKRQTVLAFHDAARDRLVIGQSEDEAALRAVLATVGHAGPLATEDA